MADKRPMLLGPDGQPIRREALTAEIAGPSLTGVRSPLTGYPADGLNPRRIAAIMREADAGDPLRFLELAELMEERDLHYAAVLSTRKRSVAQLDIEVDAASEGKDDIALADLVRGWLKRDELQDELFDILDAIGKGWSFTEIVWDSSEGQWRPAKLAWRDPRWFRPAYEDGVTPLLRSDQGDVPLPAFKFIHAVMRAKSGLPLRSGIARIAAWSYMFKAFTLRDWAIFTQTYGQPIRLGTFGPGASEADKDTLFNAVANIAGDCAAIVPESMNIEFVESKTTAANLDLYLKRADWLDQQVSKAVLGQTTTTDAVSGGHAVSQEHRQVQEDIERADARALAAILNRDLVRPWIMLERGPLPAYPRLRIGRPDEADVAQTVEGVVKLVPLGLRVASKDMNDLLGVRVPAAQEELLTAPAPSFPPPLAGERGGQPSLNSASMTPARDFIDALAAQAEKLAQPGQDALIETVRRLVESAPSLQAVRAGLLKLAPDMPQAELAGLLQLALAMAELAGRADIAEA